jgi:sec-independent protein translocase protein TatA
MLLFGAKKLPELARSVGDSARELKKGFSGDKDNTEVKTAAATPATDSDKK